MKIAIHKREADNWPDRWIAYCEENAIVHEKASAYNPQSNGSAEAAVKNVKKLLKKASSTFKKALLAYRNTPRVDGYSPAQMFLGRRQRTTLPAPRDSYERANVEEAALKRQKTKDDASRRRAVRAKNLPLLHPGQNVWLQD